MFERIDTICLPVRNVEQASSWYEKLGFRGSFKGEGYRVLQVGTDSVPITLEEGKISSEENQVYPIFFTKDIRRTYSKLKEQGVHVTELQEDGDNHFFDFYDMDGNRLQVCYWE